VTARAAALVVAVAAACGGPAGAPAPATPPVENRLPEAPPAAAAERLVPVVAEVRAPVAADLGDALAGGPLVAVIATTMGTLHCALDGEHAPRTVANFIGLATGAKAWTDPRTGEVRNAPFYDGLTFHRVIPGFMIQGGDPLDDGRGGPGYQFADELDAALRFDGPGVLAMANAGRDTNGSQFFITDGAARWLDDRHTIFGRCAEVDVVSAIAGVARDGRDRPLTPVRITAIQFEPAAPLLAPAGPLGQDSPP